MTLLAHHRASVTHFQGLYVFALSYLSSDFTYRIQLGQPATVKVAANLVRLLSYNNKVWFYCSGLPVRYFFPFECLSVNQTLFMLDLLRVIWTWQNFLQTGMIVGGWDKYEGGKIYGVPLGGTIIEQPFAIGGMLFLGLFN